jgi:hypothetical protein
MRAALLTAGAEIDEDRNAPSTRRQRALRVRQ